MNQEVMDIIQQSEVFLIGIGEELAPEYLEEKDKEECFAEFYKSRFLESLPDDHMVIKAYNKIQELLQDRPYFVVTMNTDDLIYRSKLCKEQIVAPCGSLLKMQCAEHIFDAAAVREKVLVDRDLTAAVCPVCGKPAAFHTIKTEGYLEEGYLPQWETYTKFLQTTLKKKLCVLELGVGFRYPQVIRFPFEKTVYYNKNAELIRVNSRLPQLPAELAAKGMSIAQTPLEFLGI